MTAWTRQKPTKPGWYWYRQNGAVGVVEVHDNGSVGPDYEDIRWWDGEWAGPLEVPA